METEPTQRSRLVLKRSFHFVDSGDASQREPALGQICATSLLTRCPCDSFRTAQGDSAGVAWMRGPSGLMSPPANFRLDFGRA